MAKRGTLEITILGDEKPLAKSMDRASGVLKNWAGGAAAIFAGVGVAAAVGLTAAFAEALDRDRLTDRLGAQLGATEEESARYGKIAGALYADAYGESFAQVADTLDAVLSTFGDEGDEVTSDLTAKALDLAAAFDVDVEEAINAAGVAMRTGLAVDGEEAFDLIVAAMQAMPRAMRGELLPIVEEYAQSFTALGITGEEAFGLLVSSSESGRFELDKAGDALKELTIRATDMSDASVEAFEDVGLEADVMAERFLAGGGTARGALDDLVEGLLGIEDPTERANTAIALMGTPLEDLGVNEIATFLQNLDTMSESLGDTEGAAERMGDTLNGNVATSFEGFKRRAGGAFVDFMQDEVIPAIEPVIRAFEEDGLGGAVDRAVEMWEDAQPRIEAWFDQTFVPWWESTAIPWMSYAGGAMGTAMVNGLIEAVVNLAPQLQRDVLEVFEKALPFSGLGAILGKVGLSDLPELPNFDVPNIANPVSRPRTSSSSGTSSGSGGRRLTMFHGGGVTPDGGVALLAKKERVLSATQTAAFDRFVAMMPSGGGQTVVNITMPTGTDGNDLVNTLRRWTDRNGPMPVPVL